MYLQEKIQFTQIFRDLLSVGWLTNDEADKILSAEEDFDRNWELLNLLSSVDVDQFRTFMRCLKWTNQSRVAKVIACGGGKRKVQ